MLSKAMRKFEEYSEKLVKNEITLRQFTRMVKMVDAVTKKELGYN